MKKEYFVDLTKNDNSKKYLAVASVGEKENNYPRVYFLTNKPVNKMNDLELSEIYKYCSKTNWRLKRLEKHKLTIGEYTLGIFNVKI